MPAQGQTSIQLALRDPDVALMIRVRDDDPVAFEELVRRYQDRLLTVMYHLVGNREEAEDLAQEVFLRVYRHRKEYHPQAKFSTWLFTIAHHLAQNVYRRRQRKPEAQFDLTRLRRTGPPTVRKLACFSDALTGPPSPPGGTQPGRPAGFEPLERASAAGGGVK
jgi:RNA polymerase sigma-70 factor (ECF subfamily)